jgi:hypothetical protein
MISQTLPNVLAPASKAATQKHNMAAITLVKYAIPKQTIADWLQAKFGSPKDAAGSQVWSIEVSTPEPTDCIFVIPPGNPPEC